MGIRKAFIDGLKLPSPLWSIRRKIHIPVPITGGIVGRAGSMSPLIINGTVRFEYAIAAFLTGQLVAVINDKVNAISGLKSILLIFDGRLRAGIEDRRCKMRFNRVYGRIIVRSLVGPPAADGIAVTGIGINDVKVLVLQLKMKVGSGGIAGTGNNSQIFSGRYGIANLFGGDRIFLQMPVIDN